jgi:hypothetical protein
MCSGAAAEPAQRQSRSVSVQISRKKFSSDSSALFFNGGKQGDCAREVIKMSTRTRNKRTDWLRILALLIVLAAMTIPLPVFAEATEAVADEPRTSKSLHIRQGGRANRDSGTETVDIFNSLRQTGPRAKPSANTKTGTGAAQTESSAFDFWVFEADVILFSDDDRDGYYYGIDLLIDADTIYSEADVYAVVYLSLDGGPWNEYAATEDFTLFGASGDDAYVLVTELMSGYPRGSYDLLIELFDAWDGSFLASLGPEESSELAYLPLEDFDRDAPQVTISHGHAGGGAVGFWSLLPLFAFALRLRSTA